MTLIPVAKKVLNENQRLAMSLRNQFEEHAVLCLNLVSSPGSGKTTLLERTLASFSPEEKVAVLNGDLQTENDAQRLARYGFPVRQITTGGVCHLDASMIERALTTWSIDQIDLLLIENVGNLVCPSSYDLGEDAKIVFLSVTEGEDKPLKYPSIFAKSELLVLTKVDLLPHVPFSIEEARANALSVHPSMEVLELSSTTGQGFSEWLSWIARRRRQMKQRVSAAHVI